MSTQTRRARSAAGRAAARPPARVRSRVLAGLVEIVIASLLAAAVVGAWYVTAQPGGLILPAGVIVAGIVVRELVLAHTGWSLGGKMAGIRLVDAATGHAPKGRLFIHADLLLVCLVPTAGLAAIPLMRTALKPDGRAWHDVLSGLRMISVRAEQVQRRPSWPPVDPASGGGQPPGPRPARSRDAGPHLPDRGSGAGPARPSPSPQSAPSGAPAAVPMQAGPSYGAAAQVVTTPDAGSADATPDAGVGYGSASAVFGSDSGYGLPRGFDALAAPGPSTEEIFPGESSSPAPGGDDHVHTFDTARAVPASPHSQQALIDSVPWSSVPTHIDQPTLDEPSHDDAEAPVADTGFAGPSAAPGTPPGWTAPEAPAPEDSRTPVPPTVPVNVVASTTTASPPADTSATAPPKVTRRSLRQRAAEAPAPSQAPSSAERSAAEDTVIVEAPLAMMPKIVLVPVSGAGPSLELTRSVVVGRDPENISEYTDAERIILDDQTRSVSKTHAALAPVQGGVWVTDLHSRNGTRVEQGDRIDLAPPGGPNVPAPVGSVVMFGLAAYRVSE